MNNVKQIYKKDNLSNFINAIEINKPTSIDLINKDSIVWKSSATIFQFRCNVCNHCFTKKLYQIRSIPNIKHNLICKKCHRKINKYDEEYKLGRNPIIDRLYSIWYKNKFHMCEQWRHSFQKFVEFALKKYRIKDIEFKIIKLDQKQEFNSDNIVFIRK